MAYEGPARYNRVRYTLGDGATVDYIRVRCTWVNCRDDWLGETACCKKNPFLVEDDWSAPVTFHFRLDGFRLNPSDPVWRLPPREIKRYKSGRTPGYRRDPRRSNAIGAPGVRNPNRIRFGHILSPRSYRGTPHDDAYLMKSFPLPLPARIECPMCQRISLITPEQLFPRIRGGVDFSG